MRTDGLSPEFMRMCEKIDRWNRFMDACGLPFDLKRIRNDTRKAVTAEWNRPAFAPVPIGAVTGEWVMEAGADPDLRILYLHGGGFVAGEIATHRPFARLISRMTGHAVFLVDYRLAPEHAFPAALHDAADGMAYLLEHSPVAISPPRSFFVMGDSAGANLCLSLLCRLRDGGLPLPAGGVMMSGFFDLTRSGSSHRENREKDIMLQSDFLAFCAQGYQGERPATDPMISPVFADLSGLPPLLFQVGDAEMLRDDSVAAAKQAVAMGTPARLEVWPGMFHSWQSFHPHFPEAVAAVEHIAEFVCEIAGIPLPAKESV